MTTMGRAVPRQSITVESFGLHRSAKCWNLVIDSMVGTSRS